LRPHDLPPPAVAVRLRPGGVPGTSYFVGCIAAQADVAIPPSADREFTNGSGYFDGVVVLAPSTARAGRLEAVLNSRAAGTCALQALVTFAPRHYRLGTPQITVTNGPGLLERSSKVMFQGPLSGPSVKTTIYMDVLSAQSGPFIALGTFVNVGTFNDPSLETNAMQVMASRIAHYRDG
jgi:hypothetical protein